MPEKDCYEWDNSFHAKKRIRHITVDPMQEAMDKANEERLKHPKTLADIAAKVERERKHKHGHSGKNRKKSV